MSRIGGTFESRAGTRAPSVITALAEGLSSGPDWRGRRLTSEAGSLVWMGRGEPNAAVDGPISAVVDGSFLGCSAAIGENDAARLISAYVARGFEEALGMFEGAFAVALLDESSGTLFLARDRFGVKPLYTTERAGMFAFASRPRGLLNLPGVSAEPDRRFVALYAAGHYRMFDIPPERSPYVDIDRVPPGTALEVRASGIRRWRWWSVDPAEEFNEAEAPLAERYRELLLESVRRRLKAARRPAFTLSGGLDSSSVLSSAVHLTGKRQTAFSSVYLDPTYDESDEIAPLTKTVAEKWVRIPIGDEIDLPGVVGEMISHHDEPVATATWLSHYLLTREAAAAGYTDLFGGLGGDELNAGEYEYFPYHFADLRTSGDEAALDREIAGWCAHHDHPVFRKTPERAEILIGHVLESARRGETWLDRARIERYGRALDPNFFQLETYFPHVPSPLVGALRNRTYQDLFLETIPCCLRAQDRHGAAFGVETRDPFLDGDLARFMFRVPGRLKIRDGITKRLLRTAMVGILPDETRLRVKKTGWNAPAHRWFLGRNAEYLKDTIASRRFRERGIYRTGELECLVNEHADIVESGRVAENHMMLLWQVLNLDLWLSGLEAGARGDPPPTSERTV